LRTSSDTSHRGAYGLERETPLTLLKVGSHMAVEEPFTTRGWEYYGHMAVEEKREKKMITTCEWEARATWQWK